MFIVQHFKVTLEELLKVIKKDKIICLLDYLQLPKNIGIEFNNVCFYNVIRLWFHKPKHYRTVWLAIVQVSNEKQHLADVKLQHDLYIRLTKIPLSNSYVLKII